MTISSSYTRPGATSEHDRDQTCISKVLRVLHRRLHRFCRSEVRGTAPCSRLCRRADHCCAWLPPWRLLHQLRIFFDVVGNELRQRIDPETFLVVEVLGLLSQRFGQYGSEQVEARAHVVGLEIADPDNAQLVDRVTIRMFFNHTSLDMF